MDPGWRAAEEEGLLSRIDADSVDEDALEYELDGWETQVPTNRRPDKRGSRWAPVWAALRRFRRRYGAAPAASLHYPVPVPRRRQSCWCWAVQIGTLVSYATAISIVVCAVFFPSYSQPPQRYTDLRARVVEHGETANANNEKVFIAASLYDHKGGLLSGDWAQAVLSLIDILGTDNVFLSVYENDPDPEARAAMDAFAKRVRCQADVVADQLDLHDYPRVVTPGGHDRLKRMALLADVRNRALRPLEDTTSPAYHTRFHKLLYLNDVVFDPIDAANLLFSTNVDELTGRTQYNAACAVDFINPFKFYDTFATRDLEGYRMGVPFYPWFSAAGRAVSRADVLEQREAVRVKSCWGGMIAFDARWFQPNETSDLPGVRFRSETDTFWDSSECCLIHADIAANQVARAEDETGVYMNPYIRVAYSSAVLPWLSLTRRFERLYTPIHYLADRVSGRPSSNPRQFQEPGDEVVDRVWVWRDKRHGHFQPVKRIAKPGGFCGIRKLLYINEHASPGGPKWGTDDSPAAR